MWGGKQVLVGSSKIDEVKHRPSLIDSANLFSRFFFLWVNPLVDDAHRNGLSEEGLYDLPKGFDADSNHRRIHDFWASQMAKPKEERSLWWACLWKLVRAKMFTSMFFQAISTVSTLLGPYFLKEIVTYMEKIYLCHDVPDGWYACADANGGTLAMWANQSNSTFAGVNMASVINSCASSP